jgi:hypothetical protein
MHLGSEVFYISLLAIIDLFDFLFSVMETIRHGYINVVSLLIKVNLLPVR